MLGIPPNLPLFLFRPPKLLIQEPNASPSSSFINKRPPKLLVNVEIVCVCVCVQQPLLLIIELFGGIFPPAPFVVI